MPDYNQMAARFDRFLPQIHPVAVVLLAHLPPLPDGAEVLDVACGTGEPGLTLARRSPEVRVLGVDQAAAMIAVARGKAAGEGLANVRFEVMASESLALPEGSVDAVISRFGLMMFGDVPQSARELRRVLRAGGCFSLAVWDGMDRNTLVNTAAQVLRPHQTGDHSEAMRSLNAWAGDGLRQRLLTEAGLGQVASELFAWDYDFASFDEVWALLSAMAHVTGQAALSAEAQHQVQGELLAALSSYRRPDGRYVIPHACRLLWGRG